MRKELESACTSLRELGSMSLSIQENKRSNPSVFWQNNFRAISAGIKESYSGEKDPDVEVLIPVYHNADDLPLLLYGLSRQTTEPHQRVGLTVVMHNNQNLPKWGMWNDGSREIIETLVTDQVPIKVLELTDPLLTGPYMSWQFLIAQSTGRKIAVLDADCLPPPSWLSELTRPLFENSDKKFSGGAKVDMGGSFPYNVTTRINCLGMMARNIASPGEPNLPHVKRFQGGQAAYDGSTARRLMKDLIGIPGGDGEFARKMLEEFGEDCFAFANAPVFCKMTNPDRLTSTVFIEKARHMLRLYFPNSIPAEPSGDSDKRLYYIRLYSPWFQPLIDAYLQKRSLTGEEIVAIFTQTANEQGFCENKYVVQFIKRMEELWKNGASNSEQLVRLHKEISVNCHRPTLIELT